MLACRRLLQQRAFSVGTCHAGASTMQLPTAAAAAAVVDQLTPRLPRLGSICLRGIVGQHGPPESKIRAVPFTVTQKEAQDTFDSHHGGANWFFKRPAQGQQKMKEAFLPFWVSSASLRSHLHAAEIGHETWTEVFNPQTRRFEHQLRMQYRQMPFNVVFERSHTAEEEGSSVYASYKYPRASIKAMHPDDVLRSLRLLSEDCSVCALICDPAIDRRMGVSPISANSRRKLRMNASAAAATESASMLPQDFTSDMVDAGSGNVRRVGPFEIRPKAAAEQSMAAYKDQEHWRVKAWIRDNVECDDVRHIFLETTVLDSQTSPVYIPVYIFRSSHLGIKIHTFVSGCVPGRVVGTRILDERRVAVVAGAAGLAAAALTNAYTLTSFANIMWLWAVPPAALAAVAAHFLPTLWLQASRAFQHWQRQQAAEDDSAWDEDFVRAFDPDTQQRRRERVYAGGAFEYEHESAFEDFFRRLFGQETREQQQARRQQRTQQRQQQARQEQQRQQQQQPGRQQRQRTSADPRDPLGHYKRLGVDPGCSQDEIQMGKPDAFVLHNPHALHQAAFRGQAQRWHPDHVDDPAKKQEASMRFRELVESYTVLRNKKTRADYDAGIY